MGDRDAGSRGTLPVFPRDLPGSAWIPLIRHLLWMRLAERRWALPLFRLYGRMTGGDLGVVGPDTDLVVEGFPRSANTFVVAALRLSAEAPLRMAHHVHGPAQLFEAVKRGVPAMLLVRHPEEVVASLCVRYPFLPFSVGLRGYVRFHRLLLPIRAKVEIVPFGEATEALARSVDRLNHRFGTSFPVPPTDGDFRQRVFAVVDRMDRRARGEDRVDAGTVARPSEARRKALSEARGVLRGGGLRPIVEEAIDVYERYVDEQAGMR